MLAFFFNDDDLLFNRDGRFSDKQKQRFILSTKAGTALFIASGLIVSALYVWNWEKPINQLPWIFPVFIIFSFTSIGIYVYRLGSKVYRSGIVKCAVGTATFKKWGSNTYLQIDDQYFRLQKKFREIFVPDVIYKMYYAPGDNTIVSIEVVE